MYLRMKPRHERRTVTVHQAVATQQNQFERQPTSHESAAFPMLDNRNVAAAETFQRQLKEVLVTERRRGTTNYLRRQLRHV